MSLYNRKSKSRAGRIAGLIEYAATEQLDADRALHHAKCVDVRRNLARFHRYKNHLVRLHAALEPVTGIPATAKRTPAAAFKAMAAALSPEGVAALDRHVASITTSQPHGFRVGDVVELP